MAPIRRYLRITKYSVLEVRIYLDNPAHSESWLLSNNNSALARIIAAIQPLVLPKLREENERRSGSGTKSGKPKGKKGGVKDVVSGDFEVSLFLTAPSSSTRHTLLTTQKTYASNPPSRLTSNTGKLTGWLAGADADAAGSRDRPVDLSGADVSVPGLRREEEDEDEDEGGLDAIPDNDTAARDANRKRKRRRTRDTTDDGDALFVVDSSAEEDEAVEGAASTSSKQKRKDKSTGDKDNDNADDEDDKKKLVSATRYDGFSIYGRILCLVVKRSGPAGKTGGGAAAATGRTASGSAGSAGASVGIASSQQMLENWVSTQAAAKDLDDEDEDD
ncbi:hypothetical protein EJ05DRAFT_95540 [Pseudovirgaria hyperparasitica]|uniref:Uncharacterized protein n=1 Tax=Pseudovirgaria hyperparasitica TaxID=470096 RepID=A0A6A6W005_9PEZI|nr:uncharacterized protein EJ05DRAFT_95540 [Pseudovirgaria hyperparasitica]KAF2756258.1 hypothetical protein EJ05DRAFT_95540 [Pseudovirgaria hyperparasitica]